MNSLYSERIKRRLAQLIPNQSEPIYQAARYALLAPGKRIRPLLVLTAAEAFHAEFSSAIDPACAIEMLHTYSLIHDDLPCMDDDDWRRGRPALHKAFSEGAALLTGDYLLTYAFEILSLSPALSSEQRLRLIQILSKAAGSEGMVGGQAIDLSCTSPHCIHMDEHRLIQMHKGKTAALLAACLQFGAVIGNADESTSVHLHALGEELGIAFQFLDDLLDASSTQEILGKPPCGDAKKGKATAVSFYGIEAAEKKLLEFQASIENRLAALSLNAPRLLSLIRTILQRNRSPAPSADEVSMPTK